jgi:hypothetical protein
VSHVRMRCLAALLVLAGAVLATGPAGLLSVPGGILATYVVLTLATLAAVRRQSSSRAAGDASRARAFSTPDSAPPGSTAPS